MIKINLILNKKATSQKDGCVGGWLRALPRAQITRLSWILGVWFTYYVLVLINFMTPSQHLCIAHQGINLRCLLSFFFFSKAPHVSSQIWTALTSQRKKRNDKVQAVCSLHCTYY